MIKNNYIYQELYKSSSVVLVEDYLENIKTEIKMNNTPITYSKFKVKQILKNESGKGLDDEVVATRDDGTITVQQLLDSRDARLCKKTRCRRSF